MVLFFCSKVLSCNAVDSVVPEIPSSAPINSWAGRGDLLFVNLRLENGRSLPFIVDTGAPSTLLDKSLEPELGRPLGSKRIRSFSYGKFPANIYATPKLYLGKVQLLTGKRVMTVDLSRIPYPGHRIMGVLGVDCLKNYCIQLDFQAGEIRFLAPDSTNGKSMGTAFPLTTHRLLAYGNTFTYAKFCGVGNSFFEVDTGNNGDGFLGSKLFRCALLQQQAVAGNKGSTDSNLARVTFGDMVYTNVKMVKVEGRSPFRNSIGLAFLGRNLVTLNFPKKIMYLKQVTEGPLARPSSSNKESNGN